MTPTELRTRFPSLATASDAVCSDALAMAERRTPADIWGTLQEDGMSYLAAHLVCIDPRGINARLTDKSGSSVYLAERQRLETIVAAGHRVTTGDPYTWLV